MDTGQRIEMIREASDRLSQRPWPEIDLVLREFDVPSSDRWSGDSYSYCIEHIAYATDAQLTDLHAYLGGESRPSSTEGESRWDPGYFRLFLTHTAAHKIFVAQVQAALVKYGIQGFVAHEDIHPSKEWQNEIESALVSCDALAAVIHEDFKQSSWTDQEVGWVLGRGLVVVPVMMENVTPHGFMARYQAVRCPGREAVDVARMIFETLLGNERTREKVLNALIASFPDSRSFYEANDRAELIRDHVDEWTPERLEHIERALENNQVSEGSRAEPIAKRILRRNRSVPEPADEEVPF